MDIAGGRSKNIVMGEKQYEFVAGFQTETQGAPAQAL